MRKIIISSLLILALTASAQNYEEYYLIPKGQGEEVILKMKNGEEKRGFYRSVMEPSMTSIEISDTPDGKRVRHKTENISQLIFLPYPITYKDGKKSFTDTTYYVKKPLMDGLLKNKLKENQWVLQHYAGESIKLYSYYTLDARMRPVCEHEQYFVQFKDKPAIFISINSHRGGALNEKSENRKRTAKFFKDYPEFAKRIKNKEWEWKTSPIEVIKAWEETYDKK